MRRCSSCQKPGHNARGCPVVPYAKRVSLPSISLVVSPSSPSSPPSSSSSSSSPPALTPEQAEKAKQKAQKAKQKAAERARAKQADTNAKYNIQQEPRALHTPTEQAGYVADDYQEACCSIQGAIDTLFPEPVLNVILGAINGNIERAAVQGVVDEHERHFDHSVKRRKVSQVAEVQASPPPKKGQPNPSPKLSSPQQQHVKVVCESRSSGRVAFAGKRSRSGDPIRWTAVDRAEFYRYFAIVLYSTHNSVLEWKDYWATGAVLDSPEHPWVRSVMSRERFMLINANFRFTDQQLLDLERELQTVLNRVWVPASIAVVDESLVPCKSRRNPHHVYIARKPNPHGCKVWILTLHSTWTHQLTP